MDKLISRASTLAAVYKANGYDVAKIINANAGSALANYDYQVKPAPCHTQAEETGSTESNIDAPLVFRDSAEGFLEMSCFLSGCRSKHGWLENQENIVGAKLYVKQRGTRLPNLNNLKPADSNKRQTIEKISQGLPDALHQNYSRKDTGELIYYATDSQPDNLTSRDFLNTKIWFWATGKKVLTSMRYKSHSLEFRQSLDDKYGGVKRARFGDDLNSAPQILPRKKNGVIVGEYKGYVAPWASYATIKKLYRDMIPEKDLPKLKLAISLAGSEDCPACHDYLILDVDYKPFDKDGNNQDAEGIGLRLRDAIIERAHQIGAPVFVSQSGNGAHILLRYSPALIRDGIWPQSKKYKAHVSFVVEIFPPGYRRLVALDPARSDKYTPSDAVLPILDMEELRELVGTAWDPYSKTSTQTDDYNDLSFDEIKKNMEIAFGLREEECVVCEMPPLKEGLDENGVCEICAT